MFGVRVHVTAQMFECLSKINYAHRFQISQLPHSLLFNIKHRNEDDSKYLYDIPTN